MPDSTKANVLNLIPHTCVDAVYSPGGTSPTGMASLSNWVPAPDSPNQWVPRPAFVPFSASTTQFVSGQIIVGNVLYGMRASVTYVGYDEPFAFNLLSNAYVSISGFSSSSNLPSSVPSTGTWTPPHLEVVGIYIVVTHVGFSGSGANFFGAINITNPSAPVWSAQNTSTNGLPSVPVWVTNFMQRAYFFCNPTGDQPATLATDVLSPLTRSSTVATFILTFGDLVPLLCGGTYSLVQTQGPTISAFYIFKASADQIYQVTGDFAAGAAVGSSGTITLTELNVSTGTFAPNTVVQTPQGLAFMAPDGLRIIDESGQVDDPIGYGGVGITQPFVNAVIPSRMSAACDAVTVRINTQNSVPLGSPQQEWDYDMVREAWYGPHTFPISLISYFSEEQTYIATPTPTISGQIWSGGLIPNSSSAYTENGAAYICTYQSALFPERTGIFELTSFKTVLYEGYGAGTNVYSVSVADENGNLLSFAQLSSTSTPVTWGGFTWGSGQSLGATSQISGHEVPWPEPFAFDRLSATVTVTAAAGLRIGSFLLAAKETGYNVVT
jgi:hypothetical protein